MKTLLYASCLVPNLLLFLSFHSGVVGSPAAVLSDLACLLSLAITPFGLVAILQPPPKATASVILLFVATLIAAAPAVIVLSGYGAI